MHRIGVSGRPYSRGNRDRSRDPDVPYRMERPHRHVGLVVPVVAAGLLPAGHQPADFLALYAAPLRHGRAEHDRLPAARLPSSSRAGPRRSPTASRFAPKLALAPSRAARAFVERVAGLGDRLGPIRVVVQTPATTSCSPRLLDAAGDAIELAFDFRHESWAGVDGRRRRQRPRRRAVPLHPAPRAALLRRRAPQDARGRRSRPPAYVYFRHEDEPTAPAYAARLRELLSDGERRLVRSERPARPGPRPAGAAAWSRRGSPRRAGPRRRRGSRPARLRPTRASEPVAGRREPRPDEEVVDAAPGERRGDEARSSRAGPRRSAASRDPAGAARARSRGRCPRRARARSRTVASREKRTNASRRIAGATGQTATASESRPPSQSEAAEMCTQSASSVAPDEPGSTAS